MSYSFHQFRTRYDFDRRQGLLRPDATPESYYQYILGLIAEAARKGHSHDEDLLRTIAEYRLVRDGRPYCKVHPAVAGMLARTGIDIDCAHLRPTHSVLEVRLPTRDNPMRESTDSPTLHSILLGHRLATDPILPTIGRDGIELRGENVPELSIWFDFGETLTHPEGDPTLATEHAHIRLPAGATIQQQLDVMSDDGTVQGYRPSAAFRRNAIAVAISCYFFIAGEHELVAPDIAPRHIERYRRATSERERQKIRSESRKLGHNGWQVGREIELPRPIVTSANDASDSNTSGRTWEAKHSHIRSGHLRRQPFGPRESPEYKIVFIKPTIVRPDLAAAQATRFVIRGETSA